MKPARFLHCLMVSSILSVSTSVATAQSLASGSQDTSEMMAWIEAMKERPRGPFRRVRWYCNDGSIKPPRPYACSNHGGGIQHGEWSFQAEVLRSNGFPVANLLAEVTPDQLVGSPEKASLLRSILLERFLIEYDQGWIFRKARSYRGALQSEDEANGAHRILRAVLNDPKYLNRNFVVARTAVRYLPTRSHVNRLTWVRGEVSRLARRNPRFMDLRNKVHGMPDRNDARRVREFAALKVRSKAARKAYYKVADAIEAAFSTNIPQAISQTAARLPKSERRASLQRIAKKLRTGSTYRRISLYSQAMAMLRDIMPQLNLEGRVSAMQLSLNIEAQMLLASEKLQSATKHKSRSAQLILALNIANAMYGQGLISNAERNELRHARKLAMRPRSAWRHYQYELDVLSRVPLWAATRLNYFFGPEIAHLSQVEPLYQHFIPDQLRSGTIQPYVALLTGLQKDAYAIAGVSHQLFGKKISSGLRALNPGLARGGLFDQAKLYRTKPYTGIFMVPETIAELPPVGGLITQSEGNALSHVQLLARNLGIPNVVANDEVLAELKQHQDKDVVLAVSPSGIVHIDHDSTQWDGVFSKRIKRKFVLDVSKVDLKVNTLLPLSQVRAKDSGVTVGPKAGKLGELRHHFPQKVSNAIVIPFGIYAQVLKKPAYASGPPMDKWLAQQYSRLGNLKRTMEPQAFQRYRAAFLRRVREWFAQLTLEPALITQLQQMMDKEFGYEGTYGVFVRSDTNVEDLPGFNGAGLNKTVFNVVGFYKTVDAIKKVWASPFSERAFTWRHELVDKPELVYTSVLLHKAVAADKSGVLVGQDVRDGNRAIITVVAAEGVGGGVQGELTETLKIHLKTGSYRRESTALARKKMLLKRRGGVSTVSANGYERLLKPSEVKQLIDLVNVLPSKMPAYKTAVADIEFGFKQGQLQLFQIRPLVKNKHAAKNAYLRKLDRQLAKSRNTSVDLGKVPPQ